MVINQQSINSIYTAYSIAFQKAFDDTPVNYEKVAMTVPSSTRETTYAWMGQIPNMREWIGEREVQNLVMYDYTIKNKNYELTVKVPVNDIADDLYGVYAPLISEMGLSAKKHPDKLMFSLMGSGFKKNCYDGTAFFNDKHPQWPGDKKNTQSNIGKYKLSANSYAAARSQMMTLKGEKGASLNIIPDLLVVHPEKEAIARELLFADLIMGSTNVNKNTCDLLVAPELTGNPEEWYLLCTKRYVKPFVFQQREKAKLTCKNKDTDDNVFFNDEIIYGIKARYNVGFGLWQLAFGSTGESEME